MNSRSVSAAWLAQGQLGLCKETVSKQTKQKDKVRVCDVCWGVGGSAGWDTDPISKTGRDFCLEEVQVCTCKRHARGTHGGCLACCSQASLHWRGYPAGGN